MTRTRLVLLVATIVVLPWLAVEAAAQEAVPRPFQGLFGGDGPRPTGRQSLDFTASIYGGYDDNVSQQLGSSMTVLQALALAGGPGEYSKKDRILILRTEGGKTRTLKFNYKEVIKGEKLEQNIELKPGDTIIVP